MTKIEFMGEGGFSAAEKRKEITITLEVNWSQTILRTLVQYKWYILSQIFTIVTLRA